MKIPKCVIPKYHYEYLNTIAYTNELKNVVEEKIADSYDTHFGENVPSDSSDDDDLDDDFHEENECDSEQSQDVDLDDDLDDDFHEENECDGEQSQDVDLDDDLDDDFHEENDFEGAIAKIPFETTKQFQKSKKQFEIPFGNGWKRELVVNGQTKVAHSVYYTSPCGAKFKSLAQLKPFCELNH